MSDFIEKTGGLLNDQLSASKDGLLTTNYLDDSIVRGKVFTLGVSQAFTAGVPVYFTSEILAADRESILSAFLLPIGINSTSGFLILNIYEDTEYEGGTLQAPQSRNRAAVKTAKSKVYLGATGTNKGTLLPFTTVYGTDSGGFFGGSGGGAGKSSNALIIDKAKRYLYELTNSETATVGITAEFAEL